jgi:hypothetical protein
VGSRAGAQALRSTLSAVVGGIALAVLALVASLAFYAPLAAAKEPSFDFCPDGTLGGQCKGLRGIALNQTGNGGVPAGTLYVADFTNRRIQSFDADGNFLRAWGWDVDTGGGTGFEICEVAANCKAGSGGGGAGQFASSGGLAGGIAVGQATGNVYAVDRNNSRVQEFDSTGHFIRTWGADVDTGGGTGFEICEVAANCKAGINGTGGGMFGFGGTGALVGIGTDSSGNVYVADKLRVQKFDPEGHFLRMGGWDVVASGPDDDTLAPINQYEVCVNGVDVCQGGATGSDEQCQFEEPDNPTHLATSAAGDVYVVNTSPARVYRLTSALACVGPFAPAVVGGNGTPRAVAVNWFDGHVFLANSSNEKIYEIDPVSQEVVEETNAGASNWFGLAVNSASSRMYGTSESVLPVLPGGTCTNCRIRAFDAVLKPEVITKPATEVGATTATLNGTVKPNSADLTECFFEYDIIEYKKGEGPHGASVPCEEPDAAEIDAGNSPVPVHADISELEVGTPYHFRLVAANENNAEGEVVRGEDEPFQTLGPAIKATWSEGVTGTEATLKAEINPEGKATTYRFEYDTTPYSEGEGPHGTSVPIPDGGVGSDSAVHTVSALLEGLQPGTTYHFRVLATNSDALNEGPDRTFATFVKPGPDSCPNAAFRTGPSAALPDCRAYEMVSPVDKNGGDIVAATDLGSPTDFTQAAIEGGRITYTSATAFGDAVRGAYANQYIATRGEGGWSTHAINPPQGTTVFDPGFETAVDLQNAFQAFTPDLCHALMVDQNLEPLTADAIHEYTDLYWRDNCGAGANSYEAVTRGEPPTSSGFGPNMGLGALNYSGDRCEVILTATAALTPDAVPGNQIVGQIYDFSCDGGRRLVSKLPDGEANPINSQIGTTSGGQDSTLAKGVAADASRVFWTASGSGPGSLFVRLNPDQPETVAKDGEGNCVPDPALACTVAIFEATSGAKARFWTADAEGSTAIFTAGSTLYEYDVASEAKTKIAGEAGGVVGASDDLSHLYFTSEEALAAGSSAGEMNLYLRREGENTFIATLAAADSGHGGNVTPGIDSATPVSRFSRLGPDGRHLAFTSQSKALAETVAGYDNTDQSTGEPDREAYLYDADTEQLRCASCNPSGARPLGLSRIGGWQWSNTASRNLSADGSRLFFESFDALLPTDTNGQKDVYEWEAPGTGPSGGRCTEASPSFSAQDDGCLSLISSGHSLEESTFVDASADGRDVFISTDSSLDPRDPGLIDIYDAREGGGFPPPPLEPTPCVGDACQSVPAPPNHPTPATSALAGDGNVHKRPPKAHHKKKHHKRKHHRHHNRRAAR